MATVNKDFRVKHGLVVEGTTGTINGSDILTVANSTTNLQEGTNLYFTDARAKTSAANLLTNAQLQNITISGDGNGLIITAENGVADSTTDDLSEGSTNLYFTDARAVSAVENGSFTSLSAGTITANDTLTLNGENGVAINTGDIATVNGSRILTQGLLPNTDALSEGTTNLYFTDARAVSAVESAELSNIDVDEIALRGSLSVKDVSGGEALNIGTAGNTAVISAVSSSSGDIVLEPYGEGSVRIGSPSNNVAVATTDYVNSRIALLVDSAPGALDTLNELAAALGDDPNFATTITNLIANQTTDDIDEGSSNLYFTNARAIAAVVENISLEDLSDVSGTIGITAGDVLTYDGNGWTAQAIPAVDSTDDVSEGSTNLYFTDARAVSAIENAQLQSTTISSIFGVENIYGPDGAGVNVRNGLKADGVDVLTTDDLLANTDDLSEGSENLYFTNARARAAVDGTDRAFTSVEVNSVALQVAATATLGGTSETTVYSFDASVYRSAKFLVKAAYGTHTEVSEVLLTLDSSDNIAITEYAVVSTNGSLIDITAAPAGIGDNMDLLVTAGTANTTVTVFGTLIA